MNEDGRRFEEESEERSSGPFIEEVAGHQRHYQKAIEFTHSSTKAAVIMLIAAVISLVLANSPAYEPFEAVLHSEIGIVIGGVSFTSTLAHFVSDVLMAIFFLLVGLEIKYEMTVGELSNLRQALLPIIAAAGGAILPAIIYFSINAQNPATSHGWGVPMATDIAFALGILALLGNRIPNGIRVFLSTLAVADDIIAIIVIAVFYGETPDLFWLVMSIIVIAVLVWLHMTHVYALTPYICLGIVLWITVYMSGIHSTIAGVVLAFTIPTGSRVDSNAYLKWSRRKLREVDELYDSRQPIMGQEDYIMGVRSISKVSKQLIPPAVRLEKRLYPWVYFAILPLFALANADVRLVDGDMAHLISDPAFWGVAIGLLAGKPIGILLTSFVVVKVRLASLPEFVGWRHMAGAGLLGGVGFTMAIFVANLAFGDAQEITIAKFAILASSTVAGIVGFLVLRAEAAADARHGIVYMHVPPDANHQYAHAESVRRSERVAPNLSEEDLERYRAAVEDAKSGSGAQSKVLRARLRDDCDDVGVDKDVSGDDTARREDDKEEK